MNQEQKRVIAVLAVLLVVYNVIVFAVPFLRTGVFFTAYVFTLIAILYQLFGLKSAFGKGSDAKSRFYGFPIARISVIYLIAQLLLGFAQMALSKWLPTWVAVVINILLLAFAIIGSIASETVRDEIVRQESTVAANTSHIKKLRLEAETLVHHCKEEKTKQLMKKLAEELQYSDPVSSDETVPLEEEIGIKLIEINGILRVLGIDSNKNEEVQELIREAMEMVSERNRLSKSGK